MGRVDRLSVLALVGLVAAAPLAACAHKPAATGTTPGFSSSYPDAGVMQATIELGEVTCAGKPYPGQTASVLITVK